MSNKTKRKTVDKRWVIDEMDKIAVLEGYEFKEERGEHVCQFIEENLRLYEGEFAGLPVKLIDWQREFLMRLYGWVRYSDRLNRLVRRFRKANLWVPKKNGKSPLAAMNGLYLLCADGEMGQKVFSAAKDGKQALIMHKHAEQMVLQSPSLSSECKINATTHTITHFPTNSQYQLLSSDNFNSQEGINGSVIIDEVHVVDERLGNVLRYAGASRSEPIHLEVSTAGSNPQGYGRKQYEYGQAIVQGKIKNLSHLHVCYEAPQDVNDEEAGSIEVIKAANPSFGVTIDEDEITSAYEEAKGSPSRLAIFRLYRLNVWLNSESPWIRPENWKSCQEEFTEEDMIGRECYAGLDLAKTRDTTALVLVFPMGDGLFRVLPYFWLPEKTAQDNAHLASYTDWKAMGHLDLTPGEVCDYGFIREKIRVLSEKFRILEMAYDPYQAEQFTQEVEQDLGIPRVMFQQTIGNFAEPTAEFERHVINGTMKHNGHPIMSWQVGNAKVRTDANANKRPVKPEHDDHRKIDGVVAAVMALARAMVKEEQCLTELVM